MKKKLGYWLISLSLCLVMTFIAPKKVYADTCIFPAYIYYDYFLGGYITQCPAFFGTDTCQIQCPPEDGGNEE